MGKVAFGAYTRGGAGREKRAPRPSAQRERRLPLAPKDLPVGEKTKTVGNWADIRERSPRYGATLEPGDVPQRLHRGGGGVGVGFGARRAPTHPVAGGLTTQSCQARPLLPSQGMWEARFQPGWIWFLLCAHRKRGRTPDESCLSKLHCGSSGSSNYGHCMVQYSTAYAAHGGREKKLLLETRLIAVGCS